MVAVASGQYVTAVALKLAPASVLSIQVRDVQGVLALMTKDGRRPDLTLGVWGPKGLFHPAYASGGPVIQEGVAGYGYRLAVPYDTPLSLYAASHDLKLGDASGTAFPTNTSQQSIQYKTGEPSPKSYSFSVLGLLP
jgi:hypothetical protein